MLGISLKFILCKCEILTSITAFLLITDFFSTFVLAIVLNSRNSNKNHTLCPQKNHRLMANLDLYL